MSQIGKLSSFRGGPDDKKTLADVYFQTGDFLDILVEFGDRGDHHPRGVRMGVRGQGRGGGTGNHRQNWP